MVSVFIIWIAFPSAIDVNAYLNCCFKTKTILDIPKDNDIDSERYAKR